MASKPLVTIVMPVYNGEKFLREALESVLAQDYEPFEVIVVDDGSTDSSAEIASSFAEVTCLSQANQGVGAARNTALTVARGDIIATIDADDIVPAWKLRVQVAYMLEHPEAVCVFGRQEWIDPPPWLVRDPIYGELDGIPLNSMVIWRKALEELNGFDDSHGGDMDVLVRMRERGYEYAVVPELVVYRRHHGGNMVASKPITTPLPLISLKAKLDRERARAAGDP
jgi:glycosyltransferase involved in cell wall biosynthesis